MPKRSFFHSILDFLFFPIRALTLFDKDFFIFCSLRSERYFYVSKEVVGRCLDVGCGNDNLFIKKFRRGNGKGIDVFHYKGLSKEQVFQSLTVFPFSSGEFSTVTFIATINHIPKKERLLEIKESYRCLSNKGKIIITMGNPIAEIAVHKLVHFYDKYFHTSFDVDGERGMHHDESYYLTDKEITTLLKKGGFKNIRKKYFITQWGLNHMFIANK
ncbi:MAG: hypothetical protein HZC02_02320 [Candidatus Levybacteria bacterium]|nr:hypothetical protein [Candidatus Levybacteria bacterium]